MRRKIQKDLKREKTEIERKREKNEKEKARLKCWRGGVHSKNPYF